MRSVRLAILFLGAWLAGSGFMIWIASGNFASVERVLRMPSPKAEKEFQDLGTQRARALLRYHSSEQNRHYFYCWELAQIVVGLLTAAFVGVGTRWNKLAVGLSSAMLLLVLIMHFTITPRVTEIGRAIDFTTAKEMPADREEFWTYHKAYSALELAKIGLGLVLSVWLVRRTVE
jgi:hypothetical protein